MRPEGPPQGGPSDVRSPNTADTHSAQPRHEPPSPHPSDAAPHAYAAVPDDVVHSLGYAGPVEGASDWIEEQRDAGYTLHGVTVEERDPKKRAAIYRQLVG